jgi:predicted DNA-binding transcriptional regulator AlpA
MQSTPMSAGTDGADRFLPARQVRTRYGVSDMTLWRWIHDDKLNVPPPIYIGYWRLSDLIVWERSLTPRGEPAARASAAQSMTTAEAITAALGGRWRAGRGGMVPCRERRARS